ncbi:hypothetical protein NCCP2495_04410 [Dietzia sp. NCCP-2495]|nr:hypothetical protein NCCP2495_04410 [Dietzia sp. NCCP-2495]
MSLPWEAVRPGWSFLAPSPPGRKRSVVRDEGDNTRTGSVPNEADGARVGSWRPVLDWDVEVHG